MVKRVILGRSGEEKVVDLIKAIDDRASAGHTRPAGTKVLDEDEDMIWTRPDGTSHSVRDIDAELEGAQGRIDEAEQSLADSQVRLDEAEQQIQTTQSDLGTLETVTLPAAVQALEEADAAAQQVLTELDSRLTGVDGPTGDLSSIRESLAEAVSAVESAAEVARTANEAANAASQAALEAAGIAASKGRVIIQETEPVGEDRNAANIWIKPIPDDPATEIEEKAITYVYLEASNEWVPTSSDELAQAAQNALDAREAAQQAKQRADTAISNAATAQGAAEAAQRTANQATTDAREAHNEAVAAQAEADAAQERINSGLNLVKDPSRTKSTEGWNVASGTGSLTVQERDLGHGPTSVLHHARAGNSQILSALFDVDPTSAYEVRAIISKPEVDPAGSSNDWHFGQYAFAGDLAPRNVDHLNSFTGSVTNSNANHYFTQGGKSVTNHEVVGYILPVGTDPALAKSLGKNALYHARFTTPDTTKMRLRWLNYGNNDIAREMWVGNISVRATTVEDIARAQAAQIAATEARERADAAYTEAERKLDEAQVQAISDATQAAAEATARAEIEAAEARAATEAARLANEAAEREAAEAESAAKAYADLIDTGASDADLAAAREYAEQQAEEARIAAEQAAALDATAKTEAAEARAAADAKAKADQALADAKQDATEKANAAAALAEAAQDRADDAMERATSPTSNMIHNGSGHFGNENFTGNSWRRYPEDAPVGAGASFGFTYPGVLWLDKHLAVDPSRKYRMAVTARQANPDYSGPDRFYMALRPSDSDGFSIGTWMYSRHLDTLTTLAEPLNPGDTTATLASSEGWSVGNYGSLVIYEYVDGSGKHWGTEYSRIRADFDAIEGNVLTFQAPWAGEAYPAGTQVGQGLWGGSYMYPAAPTNIPHEWTPYESIVLGGIHDGNGAVATYAFPAPVASVRPGFLLNYTQRTESRHRIANVGFFDITEAVAAQTRADEAWDLADSKPGMDEVKTEIRTSANGKNAITVSPNAPTASTPGVVAGDTWWRVDSSGVIFGQWAWTGSVWAARTIRSEVIANLDVSKLVVLGDAHFTEAVAERLFADIFTAHKITANELTIASIDEAGNLAEDSVGSTQILPGAVKTGNIEFTGTLAGNIVDVMSAATKKLVVTEETILNHATLIGQTVVDDINVRGKLIGTDGVFTGTVDFENVNVTNEVLASKISGEHLYGTVVEGGEIVTTNVGDGQITLSDTGFIDPANQVAHPGIRVTPADSSGYVTPPGIGPNENGMILTGGRTTNGGRGFSIYTQTSATHSYQRGLSRSNVTVRDRLAYLDADDGTGNRGELRATPGFARVRTGAADGAYGVIEATPSYAVAATRDPAGNYMSQIRSTGREAVLWSTGSDGLGRILSVDSDGVWVKAERPNNPGFWDFYNLDPKRSTNPFPMPSGWTPDGSANAARYTIMLGMCYWGGVLKNTGTLSAGWSTIGYAPVEARPREGDQLRALPTSSGKTVLGKINASTGKIEIWVSQASAGISMHFSPFTYLV